MARLRRMVPNSLMRDSPQAGRAAAEPRDDRPDMFLHGPVGSGSRHLRRTKGTIPKVGVSLWLDSNGLRVMLRFRPPRSHLKTLIVGRAALPPWAGAPDLPPESSSLLVWSQHPKNAKNAQRGREQARDNLASDRGSRPFCGAMLLAHGQGRKSFAMRSCQKCVCKCPGISSCEIIELKVS